MRTLRLAAAACGLIAIAAAQTPTYDLLIKGGSVIDPKNNRNAQLDVAIADGKIARVAANIPATEAKRVANAKGYYVTPGLIDIHVHVYAGTGNKAYAGDLSVYPDGYTFRTGVTTVVDAGTSGSRNFEDFRDRVIVRARTRVFAMLNIVGGGMGLTSESDNNDMSPEDTIRVGKANKTYIVGVKTAHYTHKDWIAVERAVKAAEGLDVPVMVDFGTNHPERPIGTLFMEKLRPGDIYTHCFSGLRDEMVDGKLNPAMMQGRQRGIIFDVGHGGGSFSWQVALAAKAAGFWPDSISTDLHTGSMNAGMKDMATTMSKMLILGMPLAKVIDASTWQPAKEIKHTELGHLTEGAGADVTVLSVDHGKFGYIDSFGGRMDGNQKITAQLTVRDGRVVYDLNGIAATDWKSVPVRRPSGEGKKKQ
ncbi:MAG: amidohydrolase/deacetylase family metallohydrolase [Acidobacteriota bacterium]